MRCPECGAANPPAAKFCGDCGHRVGADEPVPLVSPSPPTSPWDKFFKWVGIGVVGLFVLVLLASV